MRGCELGAPAPRTRPHVFRIPMRGCEDLAALLRVKEAAFRIPMRGCERERGERMPARSSVPNPYEGL